jgi:hypothetical protein
MKTSFKILVINFNSIDMKTSLITRNIGTILCKMGIPMFLISIYALVSCGNADLNDPMGKGDAIPPQISVTAVENLSGAAVIHYNVPKDNNVNYIEAVYVIKGKETKKKGSFYTNQLVLDGFPEAKEYQVLLYSVSFSEVRSEPIAVTVNPEIPPFVAVAASLDVSPVFGGVKVQYVNPTGANVRITFLELTPDGLWKELETIYTSLKGGNLYVRNLENREYTFGVVARDRWQNTSDTLKIKETPWLEVLADVTKIQNYPLPTDFTYEFPKAGLVTFHTGAGTGRGDVHCLWNGEPRAPFSLTPFFFFMNTTAGLPFSGLPASMTIDLGRKYTLSRFVYWPRSGQSAVSLVQLFDESHVRTFELWGSNSPSPDGSYESWTKIGDFESIRPSGNTTPGNANSTEEDRRIATTGESYDMPEEMESYRYIRYKVLTTWSSKPFWSSTELQFYGNADN